MAFAFIATLGPTGVVTVLLAGFGVHIYPQFTIFGLFGLSIVYVYFQLPLMVLIIAPSLEGLRAEWREAADNLGASQSQYWRHVGLPVLFPSLAGAMVLLFGNSFSDAPGGARYPSAWLTLADGVLYGVSAPWADNGGAVYRINTDGTGFAVLHTFLGGPYNGEQPFAPLVFVDGVLYGVTFNGGAGHEGTVYRVASNGTGFAVLHSFGPDPASGIGPQGRGLAYDAGVLYGITAGGGAGGVGTLFRLSPDGTGYAVLRLVGAYPGDATYPLGSPAGRRYVALRDGVRGRRGPHRDRLLLPPRPGRLRPSRPGEVVCRA